MITDNAASSSDSVWRHIWGWNGPNRIKHFLWLASHKKLLTNEERGRRHLTNQVLCHRCSVHTESVSHVIYECNFAMQVWVSDQCKFWINLVLSSWKSNQLGREAPGKARQTQLIAWRPGDEGWSTLNTDGSRLTHSGSTAIGGLIRDDGGRFIRAFTANIGDCSITRAELSAIVQGLRMAWSMGIRRIIVQSDSQTGISLLHREDTDHQHASLISEFLELKARGWDIRIDHVYREANFGADYLANLGHSCKFGLHFLFHPNPVLAQWLRYDLVGGALPRAVLI
ncbi:Putative ribonuclease H protein At1g65750 [Linum perenne]